MTKREVHFQVDISFDQSQKPLCADQMLLAGFWLTVVETVHLIYGYMGRAM